MDTVELLKFLRRQRLAVQASVSVTGAPQCAVVGCAVSERFEVVFDTDESTRKVHNLRRNPRLALVLGGLIPGDERTVQYEGVADEPAGEDLEHLKQVYYGEHPDGRSRVDQRGLIYVRVRPVWIRYSDFNSDPPTVVEFRAEDLSPL